MIVLSIENIQIVGKNKKYYGNFALTKEYKAFQKEIFCNMIMPTEKIEKPYRITMDFLMYHDIDAPVQAVLDCLEKKNIIENDRYIERLTVYKRFGKKGNPGEIYCEVIGNNE